MDMVIKMAGTWICARTKKREIKLPLWPYCEDMKFINMDSYKKYQSVPMSNCTCEVVALQAAFVVLNCDKNKSYFFPIVSVQLSTPWYRKLPHYYFLSILPHQKCKQTIL